MVIGGVCLAVFALLMLALGAATSSDSSPVAALVAFGVGVLLVVAGLVVKALKSQS